MAAGATSNFVADERGMRAAWNDVSGGMMRARKRLRTGRSQTAEEKAAYLNGFRSAQADFQERAGGLGSRPHAQMSDRVAQTHHARLRLRKRVRPDA